MWLLPAAVIRRGFRGGGVTGVWGIWGTVHRAEGFSPAVVLGGRLDVVLRGPGVPGRVPVALGVGRRVMARVGAGVAMRAETILGLVVGGHLHRINAPGGVVSCE